MKRLFRRAALTVLSVVLPVSAAVAEVSQTQEEKIRNSLAVFLPNMPLDSVRATPLAGVYEVVVGSRLFYVSADARFLVQGRIFDLEAQQDITAPRLGQLRADAVEAIGEDNMLIYEPKQARYQVTIFTDIDCPYCRKMHADMPAYLEKGIRVRYLFYPRAGKGSPSYRKAVSVWCAEDRHAAMDAAKGGKPVEEKSCAHPVDRHLETGANLPIRGTPAIVLADGEVIPGYLPPAQLLAKLEASKPKQ